MDMSSNGLPVNSPPLPVNEGIVRTAKAFSDGLTLDLTDDEISRALRIILPIRLKWQEKFRVKLRHTNFTVDEAMRLTEEFEKELVEELATKMDLLVSVDVSPVFYGEPPVISLDGALSSHTSAKYGMDHEKKGWEVRKAQRENKDFLGIDKIGI